MDTTPSFDGMEVAKTDGQTALTEAGVQPPPRLRRPDRRQMTWEPCGLDERLPADHPARTIWAVTGRLDLSAFYEGLDARPVGDRSAIADGVVAVRGHGGDWQRPQAGPVG